jgi:hypothetical protein
MLAPDGVLAFTFFDPNYDRSLSDPALPTGSTARRNLGPCGSDEAVARARWFILVDDRLYLEPGDELCHQTRLGKPLESYISFFTADYIASLFPEAEVLAPASPEWQHCCILRNGRGTTAGAGQS